MAGSSCGTKPVMPYPSLAELSARGSGPELGLDRPRMEATLPDKATGCLLGKPPLKDGRSFGRTGVVQSSREQVSGAARRGLER